MKRCSTCGIEFDLCHFPKRSRAKGTLSSVCRECVSAKNRADYEKRRDERKERMKVYYSEVKSDPVRLSSLRKRQRSYYKDKYAEKKLEYGKAWRTANPESARIIVNRYRAMRFLSGVVPFTAEQWESKFAYWGGRCWICGTRLGDDYHRDHVKPISKGGMDCLANLRPACRQCNLSKRDKWPFALADWKNEHENSM